MKKILEENYNYKQILQLIINSGGISRAQIARDTNLNRSTISYIVNYFMENNVVFETEEKVLTGGRASNLIKFNYKRDEIMLIDLQKNKVKILITDLLGEVVERFDFSIDHKDSDALLSIQTYTKQVLDKYSHIKSCGLAVHGVVSTNLQFLNSPFYSYNYEQIIAVFMNLGLKLYIENESNVYTNGIYIQEKQNINNLINIHIKDGIGCGQILNKNLQRGNNGFAGEIGHSISVIDGRQCGCGNKGCLELYSSEEAILNDIFVATGKKIQIADFATMILSNKDVREIYDRALNLLAIKLNDLLLFTDIQTIYITSDLFFEVPTFSSDLHNRFSSRNFLKPEIKVINAELNMFTYGFSKIILVSELGL